MVASSTAVCLIANDEQVSLRKARLLALPEHSKFMMYYELFAKIFGTVDVASKRRESRTLLYYHRCWYWTASTSEHAESWLLVSAYGIHNCGYKCTSVWSSISTLILLKQLVLFPRVQSLWWSSQLINSLVAIIILQYTTVLLQVICCV